MLGMEQDTDMETVEVATRADSQRKESLKARPLFRHCGPTMLVGVVISLGAFVVAMWLFTNPISIVSSRSASPSAVVGGDVEMGGVMIFNVTAWFMFLPWRGNVDFLGRAIAKMHDDLSIETNLIMTDYLYTANPHFALEHNATLYTWWMLRRPNAASANETRYRLMSIGLRRSSVIVRPVISLV